MLLSLSLVFILLLFSLVISTLYFHRRLLTFNSMQTGLQHTALLKPILDHLPSHRGMANALLNGDKTFSEKCSAMQQQIKNDFLQTDSFLQNRPLPASLNNCFQQIKSSWQSLCSEVNQITPAESFERHTNIMNDVLKLISNIANHNKLTAHPNSAVREMTHVCFDLIPTIVELTGQSRGIGTGSAAKGVVATAVRIKLEFLQERLKQTTESAYLTIQRCIKVGAQDSRSEKTLNDCQQNSQQLINTMGDNLLGEQVTISATDYFATGTAAFNSNISLIDSISSRLSDRIHSESKRLHGKRNLFIAITVTSPLLALLGWALNSGLI